MSTEEKFHSAVEIIKNLPKSGNIQPSNDTKLKFYSYYKQATQGPCELPKPGFWDVVNRAKWDAWNRLGQMPKEEAMRSYVEEFVKTLQQYSLNDLEDPNEINNYVNMMGPYIEFAPKEIQETYMLRNGKANKPLNNNSEDSLQKNGTAKSNNHSNDYDNELTNNSTGLFPVPVNGHSLNGSNESDSDEFSDTLERVNEDDPYEVPASQCKPTNNNSFINAKGPNIVNVRGGGDHRLGQSDSNSPAGPSGSRGNRSSRQPRESDYPLQAASNNNLLTGAGGNRRSGGDLNPELSSDSGEQLALAVIRLQHIMEQVVIRLDSLETLLTEKKAISTQVSHRNASRWSFFGISPKLAVIILAWPFIAQWLMYMIRKRQRQL